MEKDLPKDPTPMQALWHFGFFKWFDVVMVVANVLVLVTAAFWAIFGDPDPWKLVLCVLLDFLFTLFWGVALIYRGMWFTLQLQSKIELLPADAAKLAIQFVKKGAEG